MRKFKTLKLGKCYINSGGDFVIGVLGGDKKRGYDLVGSHVNPAVFLGIFHLLSRVVPNDGRWTEISPETYNLASALHVSGHVIKLSAGIPSREHSVIVTKY